MAEVVIILSSGYVPSSKVVPVAVTNSIVSRKVSGICTGSTSGYG